MSRGHFNILYNFLECMIPVGIGMAPLLVICQCLHCPLSMLAAGEMC